MELHKLFDQEISSDETRFFIIDSGQHSSDQDFKTYTWDKTINNKIREGDVFIYRKPQKISTNGKFYLYGAGTFGAIVGEKRVNSSLKNLHQFKNPIFQDGLVNFAWEWKDRGKSWEHFWNQYGINEITEGDFVAILDLANGAYEKSVDREEIIALKDISEQDYFVRDYEVTTSSRPWQAAWSKLVKECYGFECAICGLSTIELLIGSHIIPVSQDKENRKNPANGICFCVLHDKLFDTGYFCVNDDYSVGVSKNDGDKILEKHLKLMDGASLRLPKQYPPDQEFLKYHRINIFNR